jgi:hypothetical protein
MHKISEIYFVIKVYMFRASSVLPIIRSYLELSALRTAIGTCRAGYVTVS